MGRQKKDLQTSFIPPKGSGNCESKKNETFVFLASSIQRLIKEGPISVLLIPKIPLQRRNVQFHCFAHLHHPLIAFPYLCCQLLGQQICWLGQPCARRARPGWRGALWGELSRFESQSMSIEDILACYS